MGNYGCDRFAVVSKWFAVVTLTTHLARRNPEFFLKHGGEIFFVAKPYLKGYLGDHTFAVFKQPHGVVQAVIADEIAGILIGHRF